MPVPRDGSVAGGGQAWSPREVALLRAAYGVMARQGSHRLSLQDIADDAAVSKGLVLYNFKSKANLLLQTMRWALERTAARIREGLDAAEPGDALRAVVDAVWIGAPQNRDFMLVYLDLLEHAARDPSFGELNGLMRSIINGLYEEVLREGIRRGVFDDDLDPVEGAEVMRAYIDGIFVAWLQRPDWQGEHAAYRDRCLTGLRRLLGARTAAAR